MTLQTECLQILRFARQLKIGKAIHWFYMVNGRCFRSYLATAFLTAEIITA